jgi:hypothetical protein
MAHAHSPLSLATMTVDEDHHDIRHGGDHDAAPDHGDSDGPQRAGHHHHADSNSGLPAFAAAGSMMPDARAIVSATPPEPLLLGLSSHGPERPPKRITRTA